ncbi:hypothetical protein BDW02DRAFT_568721 [Decorospora gaudefroyi]|uniref:Uncharacterized protein n=1 Tax=Decorospora gaudefroyi TaxID=184978 RepID=A0A6A5KA56_9PLEO|nr:hypothetical protein BDW02DRAFT_568721 [Decorospora gaudefroyi]
MNAQDCIALSTRTKFTTYMDSLRNVTGGDFSLVKDCRAQVCGALWGTGNPDISGIGMVIGYLLESVICAVLVACSLWVDKTPTKHRTAAPVARLLLSNTARTFYDNAFFFTFAIQVASIVTLTRVDFGINADGMGGITMQIAWLVSSLTLLPLLPLILRPRMFFGRRSSDTWSGDSAAEARQGQRFLFLVICWAMGFCPFFSRMGGTFGQSRIGNESDAAVSTVEWNTIGSSCFDGIKTLHPDEEKLITVFGIISYLLLSIVVISKIILSAAEDENNRQPAWLREYSRAFDDSSKFGTRVWLVICAMISAALIVQFWALFRFRRLQSSMSEAAGGNFSDAEWTFGQIVAVVVFIPVLSEIVFLWKRRSLYLV